MTVLDFNKAKTLKTLKKNGEIFNKKQVKFYEIPEELRKVGVESIVSTDGQELSDENFQKIIEAVKELAIKK